MLSVLTLAIASVVLGPPMGMPPVAPSTTNPGSEVVAAEEPALPIVESPRPTVEQLAQGEAYRILLGERTHITFRSEAPMGSFEGTCSEVLGFAIVERGCLRTDWTPKEDDTGTPRGVLLAGTFAVPVAAIDTGNAQRDVHMASAEWMNASTDPAVLFELAAFEQPRLVRHEAGVSTFEGALLGDMVVHGVRKPLRIENATVAMMPEGEASARFGPGNLLMIRCAYTIKLADFGLDHPLIGRSVGKSVRVEQVILMSSAPVDEPPTAEPEPIETPPVGGERLPAEEIIEPQ